MNQEDKELLLKDLCARLPYGVKVFYEYVDDLDKKTYGYSLTLNTWCIDELAAGKAVVKPYLRSMSNMTEEEYKELKSISPYYGFAPYEYIGDWCPNYEMVDWCNKNHFDYRGLIGKGLAIAVTKENNPYED